MSNIPKKCICGCTTLVVESDGPLYQLECDDCLMIVATGIDIVDGEIIKTDKFEDWTDVE